MKPILYKANETDFRTLGLGVLADETSTLATEERNGQFYLEMKYPINGKHFKEIKNDRIIKAHASNNLRNQRFKIIRISKPAKGIVTVYAEHVSNHTADLPLKAGASYNGSASQALVQWANNIADVHPFTTYSDITTQGKGKWTVEDVENARQALGGVQGSILDTYGGEYRFDNYDVSLLAQRGSDNGVPIMYGKNLIDLEQEEEIASTYTSIYPYAIYTPEREEGQKGDIEPVVLTLPEHFIDSEHVNKYARRKVLKVNFTADEIETVEQLRTRTERYIQENDVGVPKVNLRVKFVDLAKTLDYKGKALIEEINLCDWVVVYFERLGINQRAKVIKTVWNVSLDRYEEIEIGEVRASLTRSISSVVDGKIERIKTQVNEVRASANGKNKNHYGPEEPDASISKEGDNWFKPIGNGDTEIYRYNGHMWVFVLSTADITKNTRDIEEQQKDIDEAKETADEALSEIDEAIRNAGFTSLDDTIKNLQTSADNAFEQANVAKDSATSAYDTAMDLIDDVDGFRTDVSGFTQTVNDYQGQVANFRADVNGFQSTVAQYTDDVSGYVTQVSSFRNTVDGFQSTVATYSDDVRGYATQVSTLNNTVNGFNSTVAQYGRDVSGYATQVSTLNNTVNGFNSTVANIDGRVSTLSNTVDGLSSTVSGYDGRISTVEQLATGLQTTVASKANQSQVTQLSNAYNIFVGGIESKKNLLPSMEHGSISSFDGDEYSISGYIRSPYIPVEPSSYYIASLDGSPVSHTIYSYSDIGQFVSSSSQNTSYKYVGANVKYIRVVVYNSNPDLKYQLEKGFTVTEYVPFIGDVSSAQISMLQDNINLRVEKGDLLSQINIEADRMLFQSEKILLDANNVIFSGRAWIPSAVIGDIEADKITSGILDAGQITVVNLDVDSLSGNTSNFVQSAWNTVAGGSVSISGSGIVSTASDGSQTLIQNGVSMYRNPGGSSLGSIGYRNMGASPHLAIQASWGTHFSVFTRPSENTDFHAMQITNDWRTEINTTETRVKELYAGNTRVNKIVVSGPIETSAIGGILNNGNRIAVKGYSGAELGVGGNSQAPTEYQRIFMVDSTRGYMYRPLSMEGNNITNQSDRRLKLNIKATDISSLDSIKSIKFVEFDRTNGNHDEIGVIAQDTPSLALYDSERDVWSINSSKQIMMNSHAIQQLYFEFDERVESNESKIHKLQQELSKANRRIKELESRVA